MTPEDLVEFEQIKRLKYAYARCLDLKLWDEIAGLFTPDAVAAYSGGGYTFEGRDDDRRVPDPVDGRRDVPLEPQDAPSGDRAHRARIRRPGVWALDDTVIDTQWNITIRGASFYNDEYVKRDGRWMIARTSYRRVFEELQPRGNVEGLSLTASWWATDGRSKLPAG